MIKNKKGITLIALVITIIVLLILAGVTLSMVVGDNGLITKTINANKENDKNLATEDVKIAVAHLELEEEDRTLTDEEKRKLLEDELKKYDKNSKVKTKSTNKIFVAEHKGYEFEIDNTFSIIVKELFNEEEWKDTAPPEDVFIWKSDDKNSEDYGVIVGYTANVDNYPVLRIPIRCKKIEAFDNYTGSEAKNIVRSYTAGIRVIELPETVVEIGNKAFCGVYTSFESLEKITIPSSVTKIGNYAFAYCENLEKIEIPWSVEEIGNSAFRYCGSLESMIVHPQNKKYDSRDNCNAIIETASNTLLFGCKNTSIPQSITTLNTDAFYGCRGLTNIKIPTSVTSIGSSAFSDCNSLISIEIPSSVTNVGNSAFYGCDSLKTVILSTGITEIGSYTFAYCPNLVNITIPNTITQIYLYAFENISPNAVFNIEKGSYVDNWLQSYKKSTQTINYITE